MSKDTSRLSSATGSLHVSSPRETGPEPQAKETAQSGHLSPSTSSCKIDLTGPALSNGETSRTAPEVHPSVSAGSQPMTASNSITSNPAATDAGSSAAAPYGTRSRNRNGTSRPNYAEDKELDVEFEVATNGRDNSAGRNKQARGADQSGNIESDRLSNHSRNHTPRPDQTGTVLQGHHKEPIPGTSTFSASPAANASQPTKRRKAATQLTSVIAPDPQAHTGSHFVPAAQTVTRRSSLVTQTVGLRESNMLSFDGCGGRLKGKNLVADDGTILEVNDHVYLVCEPPGEPYYLGRIMEFLHVSNDHTQPIDALRLNWYYRPKDIGRKVNDTRQVFASMHSDISPLTALRGKCQIKHKSEVERMDELRKTKDCFWYEKLYDRYIHRFYDVIPTNQVINVPVDVKKVLDERWKYIIVEPGRGKELTSAVKSCKRCNKYCASNDSVDCAVCHSTYHMSCVNPPLLKKPSRGFAWACGPCSKAQEKKLEARNTPNLSGTITDAEEDDLPDEEDDSSGALDDALDTNRTSPIESKETPADTSIHPGTAEQIHQASLWLFRYLGIHCKVEDALDYDDRIYPRASSRLGPRHQANITQWLGRPVEYVKATEIKKKYLKGGSHKKDAKLTKETIAALEADKLERDKRPKWVIDEPAGYVHRGEDLDDDDPKSTSTLLFDPTGLGHLSKMTEGQSDHVGTGHLHPEHEQMIHDYMKTAKGMAKKLGLPDLSTNLLDVALETLKTHEYNAAEALASLLVVDKKAFKEPELSPAELKKFEDGVTKYGSEWHSIKKHVKSVSPADIVRFYYTWKKTERGKQVWGSYSGRKGKKEAKKAEVNAGKLQDDVADENDDSAFDNNKAYEKKRGFQCKFCTTRSSRQWRRAPNTPAATTVMENPNSKSSGKDKGNQLMVALCQRCAELWRRYAIQWEDIDEVAKKLAQTGSRSGKRKVDEELLKELQAANEGMHLAGNSSGPISANGTPVPFPLGLNGGSEPPRKKLKGNPDQEAVNFVSETNGGAMASHVKKKPVVDKPPPPPPVPEPPKAKVLPCAICGDMDPMGDQHLTCKECRMTVHRNCYGVVGDNRSASKWVCDMCSNDKNPQVSVQYKCVLCPIEYTEQDFVEPPRHSHKKKTEKDRERDRLEREHALKVADYFRKKQEEMNKPLNPREPLKRTANNNWVHVTCAVFTPEVKFGNANALEPSEGIPLIPSSRYNEMCKVCKQKGGACVSCHTCRVSVHVECAHQAGYVLGFDITPVKGSRRDQSTTVDINGESGTMAAAIWCKEHVPTKTIVHRMNDTIDNTGLNALQLFVQKFKQADLGLTGTVRKATLLNQSTKIANPVPAPLQSNRRTSTTTSATVGSTSRASPSHINVRLEEGGGTIIKVEDFDKACVTCGIDVSPRWYPFPSATHSSAPIDHSAPVQLLNGTHHISESLAANAPLSEDPAIENGGAQVALAVAALHQNTRKPNRRSAVPIPTEFQCHKCHSKKSQKEPSLPPPTISPKREESKAPAAVPTVPVPEPDISRQFPHYSWPHPPSYPQTSPYNNWSQRSPTPQGVVHLNQLNGNHSPRISSMVSQPSSGQPQQRQSVQAIPHSPHQNGPMNQATNGYPTSPHHSITSPGVHLQNATYNSYGRPAPQHLTNGGPPPRAPEQPFPRGNSQMRPHSSFGPAQTSPPLSREQSLQGQEVGGNSHSNITNAIRPHQGQVNGGASASPSLRNLLS